MGLFMLPGVSSRCRAACWASASAACAWSSGLGLMIVGGMSSPRPGLRHRRLGRTWAASAACWSNHAGADGGGLVPRARLQIRDGLMLAAWPFGMALALDVLGPAGRGSPRGGSRSTPRWWGRAWRWPHHPRLQGAARGGTAGEVARPRVQRAGARVGAGRQRRLGWGAAQRQRHRGGELRAQLPHGARRVGGRGGLASPGSRSGSASSRCRSGAWWRTASTAAPAHRGGLRWPPRSPSRCAARAPVARALAGGDAASCSGLAPGIMMALLPRAVRPEHLATALGVFYAFFYLGMAVSQTLAGLLRDITGDPRCPYSSRRALMVATVRGRRRRSGASRTAPAGSRCRLSGMRELGRHPPRRLLRARPPAAGGGLARRVPRARRLPARGDGHLGRAVRRGRSWPRAQRAWRSRCPCTPRCASGVERRGARPRGQPGCPRLLLRPLRPLNAELPLRPRRRQRHRRRGRDAAARRSSRRSSAATRGPCPAVSRPGRPAAPHLRRLDFPVPSRAGAAGAQAVRAPRARRPHGAGRATSRRAAAACTCCRHCPIPPVYGGRFFAVPARGRARRRRGSRSRRARRHVTFGDPDFLNGPTPRARGRARAPRRVPRRHLRLHGQGRAPAAPPRAPPELRARSAALFVVSAVESLSDTRARAPREGPHARRHRDRARGHARGRHRAAPDAGWRSRRGPRSTTTASCSTSSPPRR